MKLLVAFDFDHTIIHFNSDTVFDKLIPEKALTKELKSLRNGPLWLDYMQEIFKILHRNNIKKEEILKICAECSSTRGMIDLIKNLKTTFQADVIIISDSNSVFIEHWLKFRDMDKYIDRIYTNPGKFNEEGLLEVQMYHEQDWCKLSLRNLCKGHVLNEFIEEKKKNGITYDVVAYVGDGRNDLCPLTKLSASDYCFPRLNYSLYKLLNEDKEVRSQIKASIHPWSEGSEILEVLQKCCLP